jgi:hypothetical protein
MIWEKLGFTRRLLKDDSGSIYGSSWFDPKGKRCALPEETVDNLLKWGVPLLREKLSDYKMYWLFQNVFWQALILDKSNPAPEKAAFEALSKAFMEAL